MSVLHNPYRLYEFLPPKAIAGKESGDWQLLPGLADSVHYLAEIVASKEAIEESTPWETRFHHYDKTGRLIEISDDPELASENFMAHLGSVACEGRRTFAFDRPLCNSPTGANHLRLETEATCSNLQESYTHTLTTYRPLTRTVETIPTLFDEDEYLHMTELVASGQLEAWELQHAQQPARTTPHTEPLPTIPYQDIRSQFVFRIGSGEDCRQRIYTATFRPKAGSDLTRLMTPVNADFGQIEAAYAPPNWPRLTPGQNMVRQHAGAHALVHHNLSLALRHLTGDLPG